MAEYKFNHFVPQSYLNNWGDSKNYNHIWLYNKQNKTYLDRSADKVLGINYFYSMKYSLFNPFLNEKLLSEEDLRVIFSPLDQCHIVFEEQELTNDELLAINFPNFDNWKISYNNGSTLSIKARKHIQSLILSKKIPSLEKHLSTIENNWQALVQKIINFSEAYINQDHDLRQKILNNSDIIELYDFVALQFLRTPKHFERIKNLSNELFEITLLKDFTVNNLNPDTPAETIFLKDLKNKKSNVVSKLFKQFSIELLIVDGLKFFYTSDNPVILLKNNNDILSLFMPITPKIVTFINNTQSNKILLHKNLPEIKVEEINTMIIDNASEVFITNQEICSPGFVREK